MMQRRLQSLLAERARGLLAGAEQLLDRAAEPRRWAAFRSRYASLSEEVDPPAAAAAYRALDGRE